jgi:hypothetical protein
MAHLSLFCLGVGLGHSIVQYGKLCRIVSGLKPYTVTIGVVLKEV